MFTTKIRICVNSRNQIPYLMIIKEYYHSEDKLRCYWAEVMYQEDLKESEIVIG